MTSQYSPVSKIYSKNPLRLPDSVPQFRPQWIRQQQQDKLSFWIWQWIRQQQQQQNVKLIRQQNDNNNNNGYSIFNIYSILQDQGQWKCIFFKSDPNSTNCWRVPK